MKLKVLLAAVVVLALAAPAFAASIEGRYSGVVIGKKPAGLNGQWELAFDATGGYTMLLEGKKMVTGTATVAGGTITFGNEAGKAKCAKPGKYKWSVKGGLSLTFKLVSDTCAGRKTVLTAGTFFKQ
jgi:hypothetical protein